ncbi:hypothetical protein CK203_078387 [Vitis vinifera]|uniref:Uncharacterized protein n=1 Tax=Vitis vinifera TaxID=29760 RepID=A0A438DXI2_VITVI|nr:hypothetical protein CK203_078387 [Vitis vinifera]
MLMENIRFQRDNQKVQTPEDILNANCLIFPGVGAFAAAMDVLNKKGLVLLYILYSKIVLLGLAIM